MKRPPRVSWTLLVLLTATAAVAQAPPAWVGRDAEMEAHLRTAKVVRLEDLGTGVTHPRRAFLDPDAPFASLTWKVLPPGRLRGYWESYKSEIAGYELDKLLDLHMVPPAVERVIDGETGAAVMWIDGTTSVKDLGGKMPSGPQYNLPIRRMQLFDNLIGNPDRNAGNILIDASSRVILIDHSRAFADDGKLPFEFERVDAALWTKVKALTREQLSGALARWLDAERIDAMLERRRAIEARVDDLVKRRGASAVIIP
jgi:hypothetical protein